MQILTMMMMMMMMMSFLYTALADQGLDCHNDFHSSFTCVWNTSKLNIRPETSCSISLTVNNVGGKPVMNVQMSPDPTQPHIRTATIDFYDKKVQIIMLWSLIHGEVTCEGYPKPLVKIEEHEAENSVVKVAPPQIVEVRGLNVSWSISFTPPEDPKYEVQYRSTAESWTDTKPWKTEDTYCKLPEEHLFLHQQYVIRVRVKLQYLPNAIWSDWSKEYNWTSEVGQIPPTPGLDCHNDFHSSFTCVWNTSKLNIRPETSCSISLTVDNENGKPVMNVQMSPDPTQPHIRTATIDFYEKKVQIIMLWSLIHGEVTCEGYPKPLVKIEEHLGQNSVVKVAPPQIVEVRGLNVSWSISFTPPEDPKYEVQYRSTAESWTDTKPWKTEDTYCKLPEEHLFLHQQYVIRVRVKLQYLPNAIWSDWSKEYNWTSEVGQIPPTPGLDCHNDFHSSFTCVWNTSKLNIRPETSCSISLTVDNVDEKPVMNVQMSPDPTQPHIRTATIDFYEKKVQIIIAWSLNSGEVTCEGYPKPLVKIEEHEAENSVVKVAPPQIVEVRGLNVSWSISFTPPLDPEYEVQYRSTAESWTDTKPWKTEDTYCKLPEEHLFLHQQYVIRVRVKLQYLPNAIWSDWSKEYNWTSEVGQIPPTRPTPARLH